MGKIRLIIADDNEQIRSYMGKLFSFERDIEFLGSAASGAEAVELVQKLKPDVVVMDIEMESRIDGIEAIETIHKHQENVRCIVLTIHKEDEYLFQAYTAGAMDYLVKTSSAVDILNSVRNVYNNIYNIRPDSAQILLKEFSRLRNEQVKLRNQMNIIFRLTNAEIEIIKAFYRGESYSSICKNRHVEMGTVKTHVNHILKKFGVHRMTEVIKIMDDLNVMEKLDAN